MKLRLFAQICLGSILIVGLAQPQLVAQAANATTRPLAIPQPIGIVPELPPLRPLLPEPDATVRLVLKRGERRVYVYRGTEQVATYPVAVGREGWETPMGSWQVIDMQEQPTWVHPFTGAVMPAGPENPLGERWIGFWTNGRSYIGFHGTPTRESVGRAASHGCVRMYNEDVRELYKTVKLGTPVTVEP